MSRQAEAGKGDSPRSSHDLDSYDKNYQPIFGQTGPLARKKLEDLKNDKSTKEETAKS